MSAAPTNRSMRPSACDDVEDSNGRMNRSLTPKRLRSTGFDETDRKRATAAGRIAIVDSSINLYAYRAVAEIQPRAHQDVRTAACHPTYRQELGGYVRDR